ncbi:hypothetical protein CK203_106956 [Vitis vinifera]|uniref:Uncharacterized protein n=1 Tax=Vitis vinifera TaxID=29760 RepID=A0A438FDK3_VITVI|nr:hypothetical protein CK203_106956 [Vitis vinifera]
MGSSGINDWIKNLYGLKSRVHPSGNYVDHQRCEYQHWRRLGEDDNFEWRLAIERRQLASERQLKALLQETEKLREEKRCVMHPGFNIGGPSTSAFEGPSSKLRPQQEPESIYPGTTGAIPGACDARPHEPRTPMPRAPREESSDSTHFQQKDNVIKNLSCQFDARKTRPTRAWKIKATNGHNLGTTP